MPRASFVVPVRNGENFIGQSIDSLLNQTIEDIEVIAVNDQSNDKTFEILESIQKKDSRLKVINLEENVGVAAARNIGTRASLSPIILPADGDDPNFPNRAEVSLIQIEKKNADIFYGNLMRLYTETGEKMLRHFQPYDEKLLRSINIIPHAGSSAYKRTVFDQVGGYDETFKIGEDYDFFLSAQELGFVFTSENIALSQYTMHQNQTTNSSDPEKIRNRQYWNRLVRAKHGIFSVDLEYVKKKAEPQVVDFYVNKNFPIWFGPESIPEKD